MKQPLRGVVAPLRGTVDFLLESSYVGRIIGVMTDLIQRAEMLVVSGAM
jgi:hypothetical protein